MAESNPDWETLRKFRFTVPEKYREICISHLSKMLDSDVDELMNFMAKIAFFNEKKNADGPPVTHQMVVEIEYLIQQLKLNNCLKTPLLFRKPGSTARCNQLRKFLAERRFAEIELGSFTPCDLAGVLKKILQDPKDPLLTSVLYIAYCQVQGLVKPGMTSKQVDQAYSRQLAAIRILFLLLPEDNYMLIRELLLMLYEIHELREHNQMDAQSLAVCLAPSLVCPREFTMKEFQRNTTTAVSTLKFMIENGPNLFVIPAMLMTDVRRQMLLQKISLFGKNDQLSNIQNTSYGSTQVSAGHESFRRLKSANNFQAPQVASYKKEIIHKSRSFLHSPTDEGYNSTLTRSQVSQDSPEKRKRFWQKLFPDKGKSDNETLRKEKRWSWLPKSKDKTHNATIATCGARVDPNKSALLNTSTFYPSRAEAENKVRVAMTDNVIPSYLKVQPVGKIDSRQSVSESFDIQGKKVMSNTFQPSLQQAFASPSSTVIRRRTFVVRKHSYDSRLNRAGTVHGELNRASARRRSTFLLKDSDHFDGLPSIFNSDSDLDEVFSDDFSQNYSSDSSANEQDMQLWNSMW